MGDGPPPRPRVGSWRRSDPNASLLLEEEDRARYGAVVAWPVSAIDVVPRISDDANVGRYKEGAVAACAAPLSDFT
jgi:hypothetical protein